MIAVDFRLGERFSRQASPHRRNIRGGYYLDVAQVVVPREIGREMTFGRDKTVPDECAP